MERIGDESTTEAPTAIAPVPRRAGSEAVGERTRSIAGIEPAVIRRALVSTITPRRSAASSRVQRAARLDDRRLPEPLRSGVEQLSGLSMDDVDVHYNSTQPAKLGALAFATRGQIHLGPGQQEHLPHEAWHLVQQSQGRVQATTQLKTGAPVNESEIGRASCRERV